MRCIARDDARVPRRPRIPAELVHGPFDLATARIAGLSRAQLLGKKWRRLGPETYVHRDVSDDLLVRLRAASLRLPNVAVFSGPTAAFLHSLDTRCNVIEATIPSPTHISRRVGITIRRRRLAPDEVVIRKGLRVTSPLRTIKDLTTRLEVVEAVVLLDTALHKRLIRLDQVPCHREHVEPASESPMETRLRMLLVLAGLPRPLAQVRLGDANTFIGRADLYYPDARLIIEYDGGTHKTSFAADNRRQNRLLEAGYRILRFSAPDVVGSPDDVIALVRSALSEAATGQLPRHQPHPGRSAPPPGRAGPRAA